MITFPNAKINLGLHITSRRPDGFHNIETLFYPVGVTDALEIVPSDKFSFRLSGIPLDGDPELNLAVKAFRMLESEFNLPAVMIHLHKVIPAGAGLGGGSSDAAFALRMLNLLFRLNLTVAQLKEYAGRLGADCPFFIVNLPALATGRGDQLEQVSTGLSGFRIVIVKPPVSVNTARAYRGIKPHIPGIPLAGIIKESPETWKNNLRNDFENSVFSLYPEIAAVKTRLYYLGAVYASMSGSGSAVFGLFMKETENIRKHFPENYAIFTTEP